MKNPRFLDRRFENEKEVVEYLVDQVDVDELLQSILSTGYVDFEPVVVLREGNVVLEGIDGWQPCVC